MSKKTKPIKKVNVSEAQFFKPKWHVKLDLNQISCVVDSVQEEQKSNREPVNIYTL